MPTLRSRPRATARSTETVTDPRVAPQPARSRLTTWLGRFALAGASLAIALVGMELAVRLLGVAPGVARLALDDEESAYRRSDDPILGFELKPNYRSPHPDAQQTYAHSNAHGQRDVERSLAKPPGTRRILVLGDSVVEGHGLLDLETTLPRQLERALGEGREVLNFGVSGYCTRAEVELLETKGLAFDPDAVILVFTLNDFENFNHVAFLHATPSSRPAFADALYAHSALFRSVALRTDLFELGRESDPVGWNRNAVGGNNVVDGLARLAALAGREGFDVLVAVWPRFDDDAIVDPHPLRDGSGELIVERLARFHGLPVIRLSRAFEADRAAHPEGSGPRHRYTQDDGMHPRPAAAALAAAALAEALERLPKLRATLPPPDEDGYLLAVESARSLGRDAPDWARIHVRVAVALRERGHPRASLQHLRKAVAADPDSALAHNHLGMALAAEGDREAAARHFRRALALRPDYADARRNLRRLTAPPGG
jgi:lysophospholipase L1-like esterase